jgi:hypothetical protein
MISLFTMSWYQEKYSVSRSIVHGLVTAFCVSTRIVGLYVAFFTLLFSATHLLIHRKQGVFVRSVLISTLIYFLVFPLTTFVIWPVFWNEPVGVLLKLINTTPHFPWQKSVLYFGEFIPADRLPWHYAPVWIAITSQIGVMFLFLLGLTCLPKDLREVFSGEKSKGPLVMLPYVWILTVMIPIVWIGSTIYSGWRHLFFIYPAILMISVKGLFKLVKTIQYIDRPKLRLAFGSIVGAVLMLDLSDSVMFMIRNHPHQHVYFNRFVGGVRGAYGNFDMDYWGLSYKQLYEKLLERQDGESMLLVKGHKTAALLNIEMLPEALRSRVRYEQQLCPKGETYYFVTNVPSQYRRLEPYLVESIEVDGVKIAAAYKMKCGE